MDRETLLGEGSMKSFYLRILVWPLWWAPGWLDTQAEQDVTQG